MIHASTVNGSDIRHSIFTYVSNVFQEGSPTRKAASAYNSNAQGCVGLQCYYLFWPPEHRNFEIFYLFWPPEHQNFRIFYLFWSNFHSFFMFWPPEHRHFEIIYLFWPPEDAIFIVFSCSGHQNNEILRLSTCSGYQKTRFS